MQYLNRGGNQYCSINTSVYIYIFLKLDLRDYKTEFFSLNSSSYYVYRSCFAGKITSFSFISAEWYIVEL